MPPYNLARNQNLTNMDISFDLHRLFDPYNFDHIPENKRLEMFPQRNLSHIRHYKAAVKIFGGPRSRKRIIIAPPMETPMKHRLGLYEDDLNNHPIPPILNTVMKSKQELVALSPPPPECMVAARLEAAKVDEYQKWINDRKKLRSDLNSMGLNMGYLKSKTEKTPLERRVLNKLIEDSRPSKPKPKRKVEKHLDADPTTPVPMVNIPSPLALHLLDKFVQEHHIRLLDLFASVDKDKNWTISREEFKSAMKMHNVPLSNELIDDLVLALDSDNNDELDFRELAKGMKIFRNERREMKRKEMSGESVQFPSNSTLSEATSTLWLKLGSLPLQKSFNSMLNKSPTENNEQLGNYAATTFLTRSRSQPCQDTPKEPGIVKSSTDIHETTMTTKATQEKRRRASRSPSPERPIIPNDRDGQRTPRSVSPVKSNTGASNKSTLGSRASTPGSYLELPEADLRPEQYVLDSEEAMVDLRKWTRAILSMSAGRRSRKKRINSPGVIKTGDKAIDDHCTESQLEGETGDMTNRFRQEKLREYYCVRELCRERGVDFTKELLDKVLLYPCDKPHSVIMGEIRQPGLGLISSKFADPPKKPKVPIEIKHKDKVKWSRSGKLMIDTRHIYPKKQGVTSKGTKMNLSTGRAIIKSATDCWMSFEQYEKLTSHLAVRYRQLHGRVNYNAFWPGQLLDKLRLCMPPYDKPPPRERESLALFQTTKQDKRTNPGYNNNLNSWPVSSHGYVQYGEYNPYARKAIH